jgi:hypothetical protein
MNANELANLLEVDSWYKLVTREEIATMLRQQQNEIGFYKQDADRYKLKCATQQVEIEALKRHRDRLETRAEKMLQGSGEIE